MEDCRGGGGLQRRWRTAEAVEDCRGAGGLQRRWRTAESSSLRSQTPAAAAACTAPGDCLSNRGLCTGSAHTGGIGGVRDVEAGTRLLSIAGDSGRGRGGAGRAVSGLSLRGGGGTKEKGS